MIGSSGSRHGEPHRAARLLQRHRLAHQLHPDPRPASRARACGRTWRTRRRSGAGRWSGARRPRSSAPATPHLLRHLLAELALDPLRRSWIGVSGFLISCAMRRATSPQAAMRCALTGRSRRRRPPRSPQAPVAVLRRVAMRTSRLSCLPRRVSLISSCTFSARLVAQPLEQRPRIPAPRPAGEPAVALLHQPQKPDGGAVHEVDPPLRVQADHPRRDRSAPNRTAAAAPRSLRSVRSACRAGPSVAASSG
jgi:hypothetical protein